MPVDELAQIAARVARWPAGERPGPWTLEVYPTLRCNLDCAFCDTTDRHRPPVDELPPDRLLSLVDEAADLGARRIMVLGGGEPLVAAGTLPMMRHAKRRGLEGMLTTNGTRLDAPTRAALVEMGWDEVHVSIDGADAPTHDALRGRAGAFRRTVRNLCALRRARDEAGAARPRLAVHTVVTNRNHRQLGALLRLAHALGATRVELDHLVAYRPEQLALRLDEGQLAELHAEVRAALPVAAGLGLSTTLDRLVAPDAPARGARPPAAGAAPGLRGAPCLKAWHHLVVQADGRTSACCVLAGEGESVAARPLREVWEGGAWLGGLRAAMAAHRPPPRCAECSENLLAHERAIRARLPA